MSLVKKLEYSNISEYKIGDTECENLVLKALKCGVKTIVIGPSALELVSRMLEGEESPEVCVSVSYPSGAYFTESKVREIEDLLEQRRRIDGFYAVMQVGAYLNGKKQEIYREMTELVQASKGIPVKIVTELGVLSPEQIEELCHMAIEAGAAAIVTSTGFLPYEVPFAEKESYRRLVKASAGKIQIIANENIQTKKEAEELLALGIDKICTSKAYEILNKKTKINLLK